MYQRILVPFDGSTPSLLGLKEAIKLAKLTGASLRIIYQIDELADATGFESSAAYIADVLPSLRRTGAAILDQARAWTGAAGIATKAEMFESHGRTLEQLVSEQALVWNADLIVLGSHGRRAAARFFLGSDAEQILRTAPVPVLIVRQAEATHTPSRSQSASALP